MGDIQSITKKDKFIFNLKDHNGRYKKSNRS